MLALISALQAERYTPAAFVAGATDRMSLPRAQSALFEGTSWSGYEAKCSFRTMRRAREVGQSWLTTVWTTAMACLSAFDVVASVRPELILVNGPGTCLPLCVAVSGPL